MKKEYVIAGLAVIVVLGVAAAASQLVFRNFAGPAGPYVSNGYASARPADDQRQNYAPGYRGGGMVGGYAGEDTRPVSYAQADQLLEKNKAAAQVDKAKNQVTFTGQNIEIAMAAVQPNFPDTTFEVAGLVDPTIVVPAGASVKLDFVNMDYGGGMNHGVVITSDAPPYPVFSMMGAPETLVGIPVLPPRQLENASQSQYLESATTFQVPAPGIYYYLCQYYDHAQKGMYGRFVVAKS